MAARLTRQRMLAAASAIMIGTAAMSMQIAAATAKPPPPGTATQVAQLVAAAPSLSTVPADVTPSLQDAPNNTPISSTPSLRRCFPPDATFSALPGCAYGDVRARRTMVLWGDSHAYMWFPAVNAIAKKYHWKLIALFKYGCPVADVAVWNVVVDAPYPSCDAFRTNIIKRINKLNPSLLIMSEEFATQGSAKQAISTSEWTSALETTFSMLKTKIKKVLIGSTIASGPYLYPADCLAAYPTAIQRCSTSAANATLAAERSSEQAAASAAGVRYVSAVPWTCSTVCTDVIGNMIVYYSAGHLTSTYSTYLSGVLAAALKLSG